MADNKINKDHDRERRGRMAEERSKEDNREKTTKDREHEDTQQPLWNPSAPYLKWKVFVRGKDSTLQGRGTCGDEQEDSEEDHLTPAHGEATRSFYENIVRQGDTQRDRRQGHSSTDTCREGDTERDSHTRKHGHRQTHTRGQDTEERDRHRKTDLTKDRQPDTRTQDTTNSTHISLPHTQPTHTPPLGPQHTHTALRLAQNGDTAGLSTMLDEGLNVNTRDSYGWSLLMVAACAGAADTVRTLLTRGARTGYRDARGNTALYLATMRGHREVTEMLIKANKRTNKQTVRRVGRESRENSSTGSSSSGREEEEEEYFCDTCEVLVKERERTRHKASIVHQFKTTTGQTRTQYGIPPSNRGYQLLVGQGWDADGGLGSEQQGLKFPVKTVLKRDRKGLGAGQGMPRVTHFGPGDAGAVKRTRGSVGRVERIATISRREARQRKVKEQKEEIRLRRMLNEPDF
ncbi:G patch domain and ankyrin repeat-containing protein 1 homolog isoform X1 [Scylla paramamosain]|uniref:G patch domain and ankyrin repeat-containing protein 1 homolog isoform X1 n=1 Tax=Scylla paramamosain TaxID=85552 RepID=UPI0030832798